MNEFGKLFKAARLEQGYSLRSLARELQVSHVYLLHVEAGGGMSPRVLSEAAEVLNRNAASWQRVNEKDGLYRMVCKLIGRRCGRSLSGDEQGQVDEFLTQLLPIGPSAHEFSVRPVDAYGWNTGNQRYRVECLTCNGVVIHPATTAPQYSCERHEREPDYDPGYTQAEVSSFKLISTDNGKPTP